MSNEENKEQGSGIGGFVSGLQQKASEMGGAIKDKAGEVGEAIKDKVEGVVGEENLKKVTDTLNTDVGVLAKEGAGKAMDAVESLVGKDLDGDGDIGGKPKE